MKKFQAKFKNVFKNVLLINPNYNNKQYTAVICAGLGYIAESLEANNINYNVFDMELYNDFNTLVAYIKKINPDLIAFSAISINYKVIYNLVEKIKGLFPTIMIIIGGPHVSTFRIKVLKDCKKIDFGVVLEGEETIIELCKGQKDISDIKGLLYRDGNKIIYTGDRPFIKNLDKIRFPKYRKFELDKYPDITIPIVTSRGCPHACTYCPVKTTIGRMLRVRSAKNVIDELEYWYKKGIKSFGFVDDNFTFYNDRVHEICNEIEKRKLTGLRINLGNGIRADKVDYNLLKRMKQVGFYEIAFGVESANDRILKIMKKGETLEQIETAIKAACELGFDVGLFFIIGIPGETEEEVRNSFKFALKYSVAYAYFYNVVPFPNSELYNYLSENKLLLTDYSIYLNSSSHWNNMPAFSTPELSFKQRLRLVREGRKITKIILRKRIKRKFKSLGLFADIGAYIFTIDLIQKTVMHNKVTKKIVKIIKEM